MKFTQLLLESYRKLNEQEGGQDVMSFLKGMAPSWAGPKSEENKPASVPVNSPGDPSKEPVLVGYNNKGEIKIEDGPLGSQFVNGTLGANPDSLAKLEKWYAGEDSDEDKGGTGDPILDALSAPDLKNINQLEEVFPGMIKNLKTIFTNSKSLGISEAKLLQKIFGGITRGSLAALISQEVEKGKGAFRKDGKSFVGFALDEELKLEDLNASISTMVQFSEAYVKSADCKKLDVDTKDRMANSVVKDPEYNTFFFKNFYNFNDVGVSLSVADGNPLNMMAQEYSKNLKNCNKDNEEPDDAYEIPEKKIHSSTAGEATNISNIVKDVSELGAVAAHAMWQSTKLGGAEGKAKMEEGLEIARHLLTTYGSEAFSYINLKVEIDSGDRMINSQYAEVIKAFKDLGITDDDSVFASIRSFGEGYFKKNLQWNNAVQPDFAVRVGGYAAKGDKSDVDYVRKEKPIEPMPKGSVKHHVKFSKLSKEAQEAIKKEAKITGEPIQEKYWLIKDSLKVYKNKGNCKMGTAGNAGLEASRLTIPKDKNGNPTGDPMDPHGVYVLDRIAPKGKLPKGKLTPSQEKVWGTQLGGGQKILEKVTALTKDVDRLMGEEFKTGSMSAEDAKVFIADQFQAMAELMDTDERKEFNRKNDISNKKLPQNAYRESKLVKLMLDKYKEGFKDGKTTKRMAEHVTSMMKKTFTDYALRKDIKYRKVKGILVPDKRDSGTMASFTAISALMASAGMDSTGLDPQSTIHIIGTGETFRHNQNDMIAEPIQDLLDPTSDRNMDVHASTASIHGDGNLKSYAGRGGQSSYDCNVNSNNLTPDEK